MRVAHVNDIAFVGSAMVRALRDRGIDAHLVDPVRPGARTRYPWKLATRPIRLAGLLAGAIELREGRFDLVHVHYARLGFLGPLSGRPYAIHCHGTDVRGVGRDSAWGHEIAPLLHRAALVYYATPDLAPWVEAFRHHAAFLPNPIEVAPTPLSPPREQADILVGVRLDPVKGVDQIAATLGAVIHRRPSTKVTIVDQGSRVSQVRAAVGDAGRVIPPVRHGAMAGLFHAHRLAVGQMRIGALGNYELEAMAAGVPVVAAFRYESAYGEAPPVIPAESSDAAAEAIVALLDDEPARLSVAGAAASWVRRHHDPARIADRLLTDYARVLGDPSAGPSRGRTMGR